MRTCRGNNIILRVGRRTKFIKKTNDASVVLTRSFRSACRREKHCNIRLKKNEIRRVRKSLSSGKSWNKPE